MKEKRDRADVTPEMIEAATDALIESGRLLDTHFRAPDRDNVRMLAEDVLSAAASVASAARYRKPKSRLKAR